MSEQESTELVHSDAEQSTNRAISHRTGMFGVRGTGDTSGYGGLQRSVEMPGSATPPFGSWYDEVHSALTAAANAGGIADPIESVVVHGGELTFHVRREDLLALVDGKRGPALRWRGIDVAFCARAAIPVRLGFQPRPQSVGP